MTMDEAILAQHDTRITTLEREHSEIREDVRLTLAAVQRLEIQIAAASGRPICSAPNTCLILQPKIGEVEARMRLIESDRDKAKGGARMLNIVVTTLGGAVGAGLTLLIQYLKHKP